MITFNTAWKPASGASLDLEPSVEVVKFGDGYEQRVGTGINTQLDKWSLKFSQNAFEVNDFLKTQGGQQTFKWTNPIGVSNVYVCRKWKLSHVAGTVWDVSAEFEQVLG